MLAVIVLVPIRQGGAINTDVRITYILLSCTAILEYLIPAVVFNTKPWLGDQQQWPDQVAQYNLMWYLARNKRWKTKMIRMSATLLVCKDFVDQQWCMTPCKFSSDITHLVHDYLKKGWTGGQITNRAFNDNRGQWTLDRENCRRLEWSLQRPFDESVILWHLATDFCLLITAPLSPTAPEAACRRRCREMSNYMAYLLFVNPEMLMTGARRGLFRAAYRHLKETLKPGRSQVGAQGTSQRDMPWEETDRDRQEDSL